MNRKLKLFLLSLCGWLITYAVLRSIFYAFGMETVYTWSVILGSATAIFAIEIDKALERKL